MRRAARLASACTSILQTGSTAPPIWTAQRSLQSIRKASTTATPLTTTAARQHTLSLVQSYDYPNYLTAFFYPDAARYDFFAIRAFNVELSNVADSVKNQQLGRLRFQWWREAVASLNTDSPVAHPTVQALYEAHRRRKLSTYHLNRLIDAREQNLTNASYQTLSDLTSYAQSTSLPLLLLQLSLLKPSNSHKVQDIPLSTIDHSLSHLATYISIAQTIRSIPFFASKRTMVIPRDVSSAHGVVDEKLYRALPSLSQQEAGRAVRNEQASVEDFSSEAFEPVISSCAELVELAELERSKARWTLGLEKSGDEEHAELAQGRTLSRLPKEITPVFLSAIAARGFFDTFDKTAQGNPFHPALRVQASRDWKLPFKVWWANWRGQF